MRLRIGFGTIRQKHGARIRRQAISAACTPVWKSSATPGQSGGRFSHRPGLPSGIEGNIYVSRYRRHYLFFREFESGKNGVMSILHERMDIPARLIEELGKLAGDLTNEDEG
jgi:hypothetical protein